ncbi:MAG: type VI secretion system baseplate subunit TssG [Piscinibacter sp.]|nr:type VI secretion system baseplate subunit TssG [Piscinibacter sp.]
MSALPADTPLAPADDAAAVFERLAARPGSFELFQALRYIEAAHPDKPRLGDAARPADEPVRFAEDAALSFPPVPIDRIDRSRGVPRLVQRVFGLMGPNGALPIHLTEYARERALHHGDRTVVAFMNMLLNRFGLMFYRAWARANPVVELERPEDAAVVRHLGALFGLAEPSQRERDALGDMPKLHFVGRLGRAVRDADGLEAWIGLQFGVPVRVEQFCGHWMALDPSERSRLSRRGRSALGKGAVLGASVWDVQHKFRIVVGALEWRRFEAFLPGGTMLDHLQALVRQYVGFEFNWDLRLILRREDVPAWPLGRERGIGLLGRTTWLNGRQRAADADELVLNVESIRRAPLRRSVAAQRH